MKRKDYEKPAMKVVKLQHQAQLLTGSNVDANGSFLLGNGWTDIGGDAWGGGLPGGGSSLGGWTDSGGSAWE